MRWKPSPGMVRSGAPGSPLAVSLAVIRFIPVASIPSPNFVN
jgi:hypothetical protein